MTYQEIARVQQYLRDRFSNNRISVHKRDNSDDSAEVTLGGEFLAVVYRDDDEGELSYSLHMAIIEEDLPTS